MLKWVIIFLAVGWAATLILLGFNRKKRKRMDGKLVIDLYGDNEPIRLIITPGLYDLMRKKTITLEIEDHTLKDAPFNPNIDAQQ